ncbi:MULTISPECIES: hypothetical protein [unclassified Mesorhizobium]|uniref:hypothetical protein n=1 Tax=unclassified Mesorhizobium TaxID=325217 RepID=UPI001FED53A5|nr:MULTISPECIES: hypothetical protein [unclassified Mesorhizobium]
MAPRHEGRTNQGGHVINCAGLYGDHVDMVLTGERAFTVAPRKGQFIVFDKLAHNLISAIILPVPSERTKGDHRGSRMQELLRKRRIRFRQKVEDSSGARTAKRIW